jgi:hypothetical protein
VQIGLVQCTAVGAELDTTVDRVSFLDPERRELRGDEGLQARCGHSECLE